MTPPIALSPSAPDAPRTIGASTTLRGWLAELHHRDALLAWTGWLMLALVPLSLLGLALDGRAVLGLNPWIKPLKFELSIWVFAWTLGWLQGLLPRGRASRITSGVVAVAMVLEIAAIAGQALRGVPSHFNVSTPFDAIVFNLMGLAILASTVATAGVGWRVLRRGGHLPAAYRAGIVLGIAVFLLGSAVGGAMVGRQGHAVGVADGGQGLPLLNWSTQGGDLRIAHALGLHALQVLPLLGWLLSRRRWRAGSQRLAIGAASLLYAGLTAALYLQALAGQPLLRL